MAQAAWWMLAAAMSAGPWRTLEPGLDLGVFPGPAPCQVGDCQVRILRIDPARFEIRLLNASARGEGRARTGREWAKRSGAAAVINASMFATDPRTSVGLIRGREEEKNARSRWEDHAALRLHAESAELPAA